MEVVAGAQSQRRSQASRQEARLCPQEVAVGQGRRKELEQPAAQARTHQELLRTQASPPCGLIQVYSCRLNNTNNEIAAEVIGPERRRRWYSEKRIEISLGSLSPFEYQVSLELAT
ncbi:hypothetical protein EJP69_07930 [Variovorax gossypii]|uniref:Uncharacterized protein n=1 Tax=Variovorax gossypii TaxID=1679495 RepID=A0A431TKY0_9BURK|nr:hypothetical protein EJP69_07930 [Variovorax gossypii]